MNAKRFAIRMKKEIEMFITQPPHGISCCPKENTTDLFDAIILGPEGTPYEGGIFHLALQIPENYPFFPPRVRFLTQIFHPNIDENGRICLDILKNPPAGSWGCANSISTVLLAIQSLLSAPNPDDPLNPDIAELYFTNKDLYEKKAREYTENYAKSLEPSQELTVSELFPEDKEYFEEVQLEDLEAPGPSGSKAPSPKPCSKEPGVVKEKQQLPSTISETDLASSSNQEDENDKVKQDSKKVADLPSSNVVDVGKLEEGLSVANIRSVESQAEKDSEELPDLSKEATPDKADKLENGNSSVTNASSNKEPTVSSSTLKRGGDNLPEMEDLPLKKAKF